MASRAGLGLVTLALTVFAFVGSAQPATAVGTRTWTGLGTTNLWSEATNWDSGVPVAGDSIVFPPAAARKTNTNDLPANTEFARIEFTGSGYEIDGNSLQLSESLWHDPGSGTNSFDIDIGTNGAVRVRSGKLELGGNNSFDGEVDIDGGVLLATSSTALGSEDERTEVEDPGTLQLAGGIDIGMERLDIEGHGFDDNGALQSLYGTNRAADVRIQDATTIGVGNSVLVIETLSQNAAGASLRLTGGGKLQVEDAFFAGPIEVEAGNLTWNASSQVFVQVDRDGLFRGLGSAASLNTTAGRVWPGSGSQPGILTVLGPTTFTSGTFQVDLDGPAPGSGYGQLATAGLALAPQATLLIVDLDYIPAIGQVFTIVNNSGGAVVGAFRDLPEGAVFHEDGYAFRVSYKGGDGNDVTLTVLRQVSADLALAIAAQPVAIPGELLVYTVTVTNLGPDSAAGARVSLGTPVGTTYQSAAGPNGWTCSKPNPSANASCTGPSIPSGESATFTYSYRVNGNAAGMISATAAVSATTNDDHSANNAQELSIPIGPGGGKPFKLRVPLLAADAASSNPE